jgi:hypothetical protein
MISGLHSWGPKSHPRLLAIDEIRLRSTEAVSTVAAAAYHTSKSAIEGISTIQCGEFIVPAGWNKAGLARAKGSLVDWNSSHVAA